MKDLETIFRERRLACDGVVNCPVADWNAIVSQVIDLEAINAEMYAMLEDYVQLLEFDGYHVNDIKELLSKARGETK